MRTTAKGNTYDRQFVLESNEQQVAFNDSFKYYKEAYLWRLTEEYGENSPGMKEFSHCAFKLPIDDEATDQ